jgi:hypothetical protein
MSFGWQPIMQGYIHKNACQLFFRGKEGLVLEERVLSAC